MGTQPGFAMLDEVRLNKLYADHLVLARGRSPITAGTYLTRLENVERFLGVSRFEWDKPHIKRLLNELNKSAAYKKGLLVAIKSHHKWWCDERDVPTNGILTLDGPAVIHELKPHLTPLQAGEVISRCTRPTLMKACLPALFAGLRIGGIGQLSEETWVGRWINVIEKRQPRRVYAAEALMEVKDLILGCGSKTDSLKSLVTTFAKGFDFHFSPHTLRRTFGNQLRNNKTHRDVIAQCMGHKKSTTASYYVGVSDDEQVEATEAVKYPVPQGPGQLMLF